MALPFRNPFTNPDSAGPFRDAMRYASKQGMFVTVSRTQQGFVEKPVPVGTRFVLNNLHTQTGFVRMVKGRYARRLVPLGQPEPELPPGDDLAEWQPTTVMMVWLDATPDAPAGIRELSLTGIISLNAFANTFKMLAYKREIQAGMLPVLEVHPSYDVETSYGVFGAPVVEVVGFIDYDEATFGAPICKPPPPILAGGAAAPRLSNDNGSAGTDIGVEAANTPVPTAAMTPAPKPANDPLARFRPAGAGKTAY